MVPFAARPASLQSAPGGRTYSAENASHVVRISNTLTMVQVHVKPADPGTTLAGEDQTAKLETNVSLAQQAAFVLMAVLRRRSALLARFRLQVKTHVLCVAMTTSMRPAQGLQMHARNAPLVRRPRGAP